MNWPKATPAHRIAYCISIGPEKELNSYETIVPLMTWYVSPVLLPINLRSCSKIPLHVYFVSDGDETCVSRSVTGKRIVLYRKLAVTFDLSLRVMCIESWMGMAVVETVIAWQALNLGCTDSRLVHHKIISSSTQVFHFSSHLLSSLAFSLNPRSTDRPFSFDIRYLLATWHQPHRIPISTQY